MNTYHPEAFSNKWTAEILAELHAIPASEGIKLTAIFDEQQNGLDIVRDGGAVTLRYSQLAYFYRALGLINERAEESVFHLTETARFDSNGIMVDCSRNAVPSVVTVKKLIRYMALMGMNTLMLYTEDTYEIPEEPYFGYMRGRYTVAELRELDAYAAGFGVELVPCIQTLAHLNAALQWPAYRTVADIGDILLVDEPDTYILIERMLSACRAAYKTHKIHVGMDEAHMLGRGNYYDKHGDSNRFELMNRHLEKVLALCKKYDFEPMMWSDMFFTLDNGGDHYGSKLLPEVAANVPKEVAQVYWDYFHDDPAAYDRIIKKHLAFPGRVIFAGGAWKWTGFLPCLQVSINRTKMALTACVNNGVKDVFTTSWGDNGAECGLFSVLPVFQAQAELNFHDDVEEEQLARRLRTCTGAELTDMMLLDSPDRLLKNSSASTNLHKYLLYQDVLTGLFDRHIPQGTAELYAANYQEFQILANKKGPYCYLFETAAALFGVLALKAELGAQLKTAYDNGDRTFLEKATNDILPELISRAKVLRDCLEAQWMTENKPFGFDVLDLRIGGVIQRLKTAKKRTEEYLSGEVGSLPELEGERLPLTPAESGRPICCNSWEQIATASVI